MKILIACEESQAVCKEFRKLGHEAYSADIQDQSGGHPEWHIKGDCLPLLNGHCKFKTMDNVTHQIDRKWDMIIAFPPCTHLAVSGARHFEKKRADGRQKDGIEFFCKFFEADCDCISIENPVNIISGDYIPKWFPELANKYGLPKKPTQVIQPYYFGDAHKKQHVYGSRDCQNLNTQTLLSQSWSATFARMGKRSHSQNIWSEDLMETDQNTGARHFLELHKQWLSNGVKAYQLKMNLLDRFQYLIF